ncbi:MAG: hypothetical protein L6R38_006677 [Xanthoria sp. 2 TBL-2021]|nr:MAG: hypothetical protein L6R38_006677 [Xanthoria sp. 2 TBL-2021]
MSEHRNPVDIPLDQLWNIYHAGCTITIPEFINVELDDGKGYWRIPFVLTEVPGLTAGMALLFAAIGQKLSGRGWALLGEGMGAGRGDLFLRGELFPHEFEAICRKANPEFSLSLWVMGVPAPIMRLPLRPEAHLGQPPGRHMTAGPHTMGSSLTSRPPPSGMPGRRQMDHPMNRGMSRPVDRQMDHDMHRGMDRGMDRGMERTARIPATHRRPAHHQPMAITGNIIASSSSDDTSTESDSSESESDAPKRGTKTKTTKGKSKGKSEKEGRSKKKSQGRKQSSESESDDEPPRKPKKSVKKDEPKGKAARRGRSPSDDEVAYSADEQRKKGKAKAAARKSKPEGDGQGPSKYRALEAPEQRPRRRNRGRSPSDDEGQAPSSGRKGGASEGGARAGDVGKKVSENKAQGPSSGKAGKAQGGHLGGRKQERSPSEDEAPPRVDPTEQARLDALKAQNGYGDGKSEKSGWH